MPSPSNHLNPFDAKKPSRATYAAPSLKVVDNRLVIADIILNTPDYQVLEFSEILDEQMTRLQFSIACANPFSLQRD